MHPFSKLTGFLNQLEALKFGALEGEGGEETIHQSESKIS